MAKSFESVLKGERDGERERGGGRADGERVREWSNEDQMRNYFAKLPSKQNMERCVWRSTFLC